MGVENYSTTPASNSSSPPNGAPEGQSAGSLNNVIRQVMADVRAFYESLPWLDFGYTPTHISGTQFKFTDSTDHSSVFHVGRRVKAYGTTPFTVYGTITAVSFSSPDTTITVAWDSGSIDSTLSNIYLGILPVDNALIGLPLLHKMDATTAPTVNEDSGDGYSVGSMWVDVTNDNVYQAVDVSSGAAVWKWLNQPEDTAVIKAYAGSTAPTGWLLCDGSAVSRTTYADLFAVVSTTYGNGDGSTTFNVPDLRGRTIFGLDNMGGSDAGNLDWANTLGTTGGSQSKTTDGHVLTQAELPDVELSLPSDVMQHTGSGSALDLGSTTYSRFQTAAITGDGVSLGGGDTAHDHDFDSMPPAMLLNYIIKT